LQPGFQSSNRASDPASAVQNLGGLCGLAEVPSCHQVRVGIVADIGMVFVRADDVPWLG
jgi:hypothetical protein